jgi:hypothetical protein
MTRHPYACAGLALAVILSLLALWHGLQPKPDRWIMHTFWSGNVLHKITHHRNSVECPLCWPGSTGVDEQSPISAREN